MIQSLHHISFVKVISKPKSTFLFTNFPFYLVLPTRTLMDRIIPQPTHQVIPPDYYEIGHQFEKYITQLFNERSFELVKWRESKKFTRFSPFEDAKPDLELIFRGARKYHFAVECKWRKEFRYGKITWATDYQRYSYMDFQYWTTTRVFIAIGIGGQPSNPDKLFVTPLDYISMHNEVYESDLIPYKRKTQSKFFYDTVQLQLF